MKAHTNYLISLLVTCFQISGKNKGKVSKSEFILFSLALVLSHRHPTTWTVFVYYFLNPQKH